MSKPFLILQLRPEDDVANNEFEAFLKAGRLSEPEVIRVRMEQGNLPKVNLPDYSGVIVGGGPSNISDKAKTEIQTKFETWLHELLDEIIESDVPYLGACYGLSILAQHLGGLVSKAKYGETVGAVTIKLKPEANSDRLLSGLPKSFRAFVGHKESCQNVPPSSTLLASSEICPVQMIRVKNNIYGTQFHPELYSTGLELRINAYKHAGYFPPHEAETLIKLARQEEVATPERILEKFAKKYR